MAAAAQEVRPRTPRTGWRRLIGFHALTGLLLAIAGFAFGHWLGVRIGGGLSYLTETDQNDVAIFLGYLFGVIGWLAGLGFLSYPASRMIGRPPSLRQNELQGTGRYFTLCTDHKVVGIQYFVGVLAFFLVAGLNAMLIRVELLSPTEHTWPAGNYLTVVGLHGTMMLTTMTSAMTGPFANYFVPLLVGAKRMAFPRLEALSFWLFAAAPVVLLSSVLLGGFPTGWTGYAPLSGEARGGMDAYVVAFALIGLSMVIVGINMLATIVTMRAPGLHWSRLPIFCWGIFAVSFLLILSAPVLVATLSMVALDRTANTSFFLSSAGGSPFLFENLFWFFGHPEVYILALPGFGVILEILPVFARKPLWGYRFAVAGMLGVALLSFFVWQHHLFVSGMSATLRPFYMLTTELISVPTGFIFLNAIGTIWLARMRFELPMLFALAFLWNFLIGGLTGVFLSDVPSDVTTHGSYFVTAHFHYTIMGGLVFAFFAAVYYWLPKMTGLELNKTLGRIHFWGMFVFFNLTFLPMFAAGLQDMPRRVSVYDPSLQGLNVFISVAAFCLGLSMLVFVANVVYSLVIVRRPAPANPWDADSLEWELESPVPVHNFDEVPVITSAPHSYGKPRGAPVARLEPRPAPGRGG
jgi:cytochrome c oxidase subunit 1